VFDFIFLSAIAKNWAWLGRGLRAVGVLDNLFRLGDDRLWTANEQFFGLAEIGVLSHFQFVLSWNIGLVWLTGIPPPSLLRMRRRWAIFGLDWWRRYNQRQSARSVELAFSNSNCYCRLMQNLYVEPARPKSTLARDNCESNYFLRPGLSLLHWELEPWLVCK